MSKDIFKQTPIAPSNLKPIIPEGTDLNLLTDQVHRDKAISDAASAASRQKWAEEMVEARIKAQREDDAAAREAAEKKKWHEDIAKRKSEDAAKRAEMRQRELKSKISTFIGACADIGAVVEELQDMNCVQVRLLRETLKALVETLPTA
jgi:hypothetical protein